MLKYLTKNLILIIAVFMAVGFANIASAASGSVLDFDGSDYLAVADDAVLDQNDRLSLSVWVKPDAAGDAYVLYRANAYYLKLTASCTIEGAIYYSAAFQTITSSAIVCDGTAWSHLELVYDKDAGGTDELKLYVNGVLSAIGDHSTAIADTNTDLYFGAQDSTPTLPLDGKVDDFKLYQYARVADEVNADYNDGLAAHLGQNNQRSDGLVGHWNFEEGSGQTIYDRSGNGNDGTLGANSSVGKDDPVFSAGHDSSGPGGIGMSFDGVDDYVNMGDINAIDNATQLSCCAWVYHNSLTDDDYISAHFAGGSAGGFLFLRDDSGSPRTDMYKIYVDDGVDTANIESKTNSSPLQEWTYVCFTYIENTANGLKLYINGAEDENSPVSTIGVDDIDSVNDVLNIGANSDGSNPFDGSIDSVRIYNRALSADEIRQLYNQKKPIFHAKMDEGSGQVAYDESWNDNNITLINTPSWITGKFGSALDLESGSSQYGYVADSSIISITGDLTTSAWIKPESTTASTLFNIAGKWDGANESYLLSQYGDEIRMYIDASANYKTTNSVNLSNNNWYHLETIYNASAQNIDIYINGIIQQGTVTGTIPTSIGDDAGRLHIGAEDSTTAAANFYDGIIDDVRIYNYARTADGVLADYNNGLAARLR